MAAKTIQERLEELLATGNQAGYERLLYAAAHKGKAGSRERKDARRQERKLERLADDAQEQGQ